VVRSADHGRRTVAVRCGQHPGPRGNVLWTYPGRDESRPYMTCLRPVCSRARVLVASGAPPHDRSGLRPEPPPDPTDHPFRAKALHQVAKDEGRVSDYCMVTVITMPLHPLQDVDAEPVHVEWLSQCTR